MVPIIFPLGLYFLLLPLNDVLSMGAEQEGSTLTMLLGVASIFSISIVGFARKKLVIPPKVVLVWGLFIFYGIISIGWAIKPELTWSRYQTAIGLFLLYLVVSSYKINKREYELLKILISIGGLIAAFMVIYLYLFSNVAYVMTERASVILGEKETDPNQLAFSLLIPFGLIYINIFDAHSYIRKIGLICATMIIVTAMVLSGSRGGSFGLLTMCLAYSFIYYRKAWRLSLIVLIILLYFYTISHFVTEGLTGRFTTIDTTATGRTGIWMIAGESLEKYWLTGAGLDNFPVAFKEYAGGYKERGSHNIYIGMLIELGIFGLLLLVLAIYKNMTVCSNRIHSVIKEVTDLKVIAFGVLINTCSIDVVWRKSFWLMWMLFMLYRNASSNRRTRCN